MPRGQKRTTVPRGQKLTTAPRGTQAHRPTFVFGSTHTPAAVVQDPVQTHQVVAEPVQRQPLTAPVFSFIASLEAEIAAVGLEDVYQDLPPAVSMVWEANTIDENSAPVKMLIQEHVIVVDPERPERNVIETAYVYMPVNFWEKWNWPPIRMEYATRPGVVTDAMRIWGTSFGVVVPVAPFSWIHNDVTHPWENRFPWFALLSFYFLTSGFGDDCVGWPDLQKYFIDALRVIKRSEEYNEYLKQKTWNGEDMNDGDDI